MDKGPAGLLKARSATPETSPAPHRPSHEVTAGDRLGRKSEETGRENVSSREAVAGEARSALVAPPAVTSRLGCDVHSLPGTCVPGFRLSVLRN